MSIQLHSTGIRELDDILGGGLPSNRAYMLIGEPRTGKHAFALTVQRASLMRGEYCAYVSYGHGYRAVLDRYRSMGLDPDGYLASGLLKVTDYYSLDSMEPADLQAEMSDVEKKGVITMRPEDLEHEETRKQYVEVHRSALKSAAGAGVVVIDSLNERLERTRHDIVLKQFREFKDRLSVREGLLSLHLYTPLPGKDWSDVLEVFKFYEENSIALAVSASGQRMVRFELAMPPTVDDSWHAFAIKRDALVVQRPTATTERAVLERAIDLASRCRSEDQRIHPKVGVVIVKDGKVVAEARRGEIRDGEHAEYTALERKCSAVDLRGAVLVTTLEPCTSRGHGKRPCVEHIVRRGISKVVLGMLDPDERIRAEGYFQLKEAGIDVEFFPPDLQDTLWEMNRDFVLEKRRTESGGSPRK